MTKKTTRRVKQEAGKVKEIKEKFLEGRSPPPLCPKTTKQKTYINLIKSKNLIIATGYPGTSKTYCPAVIACDKFRSGEISKIYLIRPFISKSKSPGYYAGSLEEKASIWLGEIISILLDRLGSGALSCALRNKDIEFLPLEVIKGRSLNDCFVICDEAEDITIEEARKVVTRVGQNCTLVMSGDIGQTDLRETSGLKFLIDVANKHPKLKETMGIVDFNEESDIVRSEVCKQWTIALAKEGIGNY